MARTGHKKIYLKIMISAIFICIVIFLFLFFRKPSALLEDYKNIASRRYEIVFLSMYPVSARLEEDFQHYWGQPAFQASYCIPEFSIVEQYLERIAASGNAVTAAYLGIRPDKADIRQLQTLVDRYPSITFEVILPYPSSGYWTGLREGQYQKILSAYSAFLSGVPDVSNARFYFPGSQKWLIGNPDNYEDKLRATESTDRTVLYACKAENPCYVTAQNASSFSQALTDLTLAVRTAPKALPDLSDCRFVFFGDSVIGEYTDATSIPGVVKGLTRATVYNCGLGGNSAATDPKAPINLPGIAEAFAKGDLAALPPDSQVYRGIDAYLSDSTSGKKLCFVINYGLNDYFQGHAISSRQDPYDPATFSGAIRTAVGTLRSYFPDARIILCTPSYCRIFQNGTEPHGTGSYVLDDYVDAVLSLSQELGTDVVDSYHDFGIGADNWASYLLQDQVHPNAAYRYLIGEKICMLFSEASAPR